MTVLTPTRGVYLRKRMTLEESTNGDVVSFTLDTAAKAIRQLKVDTYLDEEKEKVNLAVDYQTLPDGTNYAANKNLTVTAKQIVVNISASNYQKLAQ